MKASKVGKAKLSTYVALSTIAGGIVTILIWMGVNPSEWTKDQPLLISIVGVKSASVDSKQRDFEIDETNSDHKTVGTNTKSYSRRFTADSGFSVVNYEWLQSSATRVSDFAVNIDGGGSSIVVTFKLKCGPKTDTYRGWLRGTLKTTQSKPRPQEEVMLARGVDAKGGRAVLPANPYGDFQTLQFLDTNKNVIGRGRVGESIKAQSIGKRIRVVWDSKLEQHLLLME